MGYTYGETSYKYNLSLDLSVFIEAILKQIDGWDDYEFDGDSLLVYGSTKNSSKSYYSPATMLDPPEYDHEFTEPTIDESNFEKIVVNACSEFKDYLLSDDKSISECEIDEDSFEFVPDEPDEDDAYDRWRDSQLEDGWR